MPLDIPLLIKACIESLLIVQSRTVNLLDSHATILDILLLSLIVKKYLASNNLLMIASNCFSGFFVTTRAVLSSIKRSRWWSFPLKMIFRFGVLTSNFYFCFPVAFFPSASRSLSSIVTQIMRTEIKHGQKIVSPNFMSKSEPNYWDWSFWHR